LTAPTIFRHCVEAIRNNELIRRESSTDKEFHFQNWFARRLEETGLKFEAGGRNSYPDFRLVAHTEGFELKGLAYPGRDASFDGNSQVPSGYHNGRTVYYVFGRYPKAPDGNAYPVMDLVVCHGDFLNADHDYVHKNRNVKGFGSYGDILIRDRKMYVIPTPFLLLDGAAHHRTLVLPGEAEPGDDYVQVGEMIRREADRVVLGYAFNLKTNEITADTAANPHAGREHRFRAWRLKGDPEAPVSLRAVRPADLEAAAEAGDEGAAPCD
jgi:hypothetical protein